MKYVLLLALFTYWIHNFNVGAVFALVDRSAVIKGVCKNGDNECNTQCMLKYEMMHGHCFDNDTDCYCLQTTVDHNYTRTECRKPNDCYFVYTVGNNLCPNNKSDVCEHICTKWYQSRRFECDDTGWCHCWEYDFSNAVGVAKDPFHVSRSLMVENTTCKKATDCRNSCSSMYTFYICLYNNCYCLKDLEDYTPYKLCNHWEDTPGCDIVYNLGKGLCTVQRKGPCSTICKNAMGASYSCHRVDGNCRCFYGIPTLTGHQRVAGFPKLCFLAQKNCFHNCRETFGSDYKSHICVKNNCYCFRQGGYETPKFDHCEHSDKNCTSEIRLENFPCKVDNARACNQMCHAEYATTNGVCDVNNDTCVCEVHRLRPMRALKDVASTNAKNSEAKPKTNPKANVTVNVRDVESVKESKTDEENESASAIPKERAYVFEGGCSLGETVCMKLCLDKLASGYKRHLCENGLDCFCLERSGYQRPSFDKCMVGQCFEGILLGARLCSKSTLSPCHRMCEKEYGTNVAVCDTNCYCITKLDGIFKSRKGLSSQREMQADIPWIINGTLTKNGNPWNQIEDRTFRNPGKCEDDSCETQCKQRLGIDFEISLCTYEDACYCLKKNKSEEVVNSSGCTRKPCYKEVSLGTGLCVSSERACSLMCFRKLNSDIGICDWEKKCLCTVRVKDSLITEGVLILNTPITEAAKDKVNPVETTTHSLPSSTVTTTTTSTSKSIPTIPTVGIATRNTTNNIVKTAVNDEPENHKASVATGSSDPTTPLTEKESVETIFVPPPKYFVDKNGQLRAKQPSLSLPINSESKLKAQSENQDNLDVASLEKDPTNGQSLVRKVIKHPVNPVRVPGVVHMEEGAAYIPSVIRNVAKLPGNPGRVPGGLPMEEIPAYDPSVNRNGAKLSGNPGRIPYVPPTEDGSAYDPSVSINAAKQSLNPGVVSEAMSMDEDSANDPYLNRKMAKYPVHPGRVAAKKQNYLPHIKYSPEREMLGGPADSIDINQPNADSRFQQNNDENPRIEADTQTGRVPRPEVRARNPHVIYGTVENKHPGTDSSPDASYRQDENLPNFRYPNPNVINAFDSPQSQGGNHRITRENPTSTNESFTFNNRPAFLSDTKREVSQNSSEKINVHSESILRNHFYDDYFNEQHAENEMHLDNQTLEHDLLVNLSKNEHSVKDLRLTLPGKVSSSPNNESYNRAGNTKPIEKLNEKDKPPSTTFGPKSNDSALKPPRTTLPRNGSTHIHNNDLEDKNTTKLTDKPNDLQSTAKSSEPHDASLHKLRKTSSGNVTSPIHKGNDSGTKNNTQAIDKLNEKLQSQSTVSNYKERPLKDLRKTLYLNNNTYNETENTTKPTEQPNEKIKSPSTTSKPQTSDRSLQELVNTSSENVSSPILNNNQGTQNIIKTLDKLNQKLNTLSTTKPDISHNLLKDNPKQVNFSSNHFRNDSQLNGNISTTSSHEDHKSNQRFIANINITNRHAFSATPLIRYNNSTANMGKDHGEQPTSGFLKRNKRESSIMGQSSSYARENTQRRFMNKYNDNDLIDVEERSNQQGRRGLGRFPSELVNIEDEGHERGSVWYQTFTVRSVCDERNPRSCFLCCASLKNIDLAQQLCLQNVSCLCLYKYGQRRPLFDKCNAARCIEAISIGFDICNAPSNVACSRMCQLEYKTLMHICTPDHECYCGVLLDRSTRREIPIVAPCYDKSIPVISTSEVTPAVDFIRFWSNTNHLKHWNPFNVISIRDGCYRGPQSCHENCLLRFSYELDFIVCNIGECFCVHKHLKLNGALTCSNLTHECTTLYLLSTLRCTEGRYRLVCSHICQKAFGIHSFICFPKKGCFCDTNPSARINHFRELERRRKRVSSVLISPEGCSLGDEQCYEYCFQMLQHNFDNSVCYQRNCYCIHKIFRRWSSESCDSPNKCIEHFHLGTKINCYRSYDNRAMCEHLCWVLTRTRNVTVDIFSGLATCDFHHYAYNKIKPDDYPPAVYHAGEFCVVDGGKRCHDECRYKMGQMNLDQWFCIGGRHCICIHKIFKSQVGKQCRGSFCEVDYHLGLGVKCSPKPSEKRLCRNLCETAIGIRDLVLGPDGRPICVNTTKGEPSKWPPVIVIPRGCTGRPEYCWQLCRDRVGENNIVDLVCINANCFCVTTSFNTQAHKECSQATGECRTLHPLVPEMKCENIKECRMLCLHVSLSFEEVVCRQPGRCFCAQKFKEEPSNRTPVIIVPSGCIRPEHCWKLCRDRVGENNLVDLVCLNANCFCVTTSFNTQAHKECSPHTGECRTLHPLFPEMKCENMDECRTLCLQVSYSFQNVVCPQLGRCFCAKKFKGEPSNWAPVIIIPRGCTNRPEYCSQLCRDRVGESNLVKYVCLNANCFCVTTSFNTQAQKEWSPVNSECRTLHPLVPEMKCENIGECRVLCLHVSLSFEEVVCRPLGRCFCAKKFQVPNLLPMILPIRNGCSKGAGHCWELCAQELSQINMVNHVCTSNKDCFCVTTAFMANGKNFTNSNGKLRVKFSIGDKVQCSEDQFGKEPCETICLKLLRAPTFCDEKGFCYCEVDIDPDNQNLPTILPLPSGCIRGRDQCIQSCILQFKEHYEHAICFEDTDCYCQHRRFSDPARNVSQITVDNQLAFSLGSLMKCRTDRTMRRCQFVCANFASTELVECDTAGRCYCISLLSPFVGRFTYLENICATVTDRPREVCDTICKAVNGPLSTHSLCTKAGHCFCLKARPKPRPRCRSGRKPPCEVEVVISKTACDFSRRVVPDTEACHFGCAVEYNTTKSCCKNDGYCYCSVQVQ